MRIKIHEVLEEYNSSHDTNLSLKDLALMAYKDQDTIDQTKINRISALNTGRATATINDLVRLSDVLNCEPTDLIEL